ncbi:hypothetical protein E8E13_008727 [Curvularia kusanoi]|uniref:Protein kinase domain-containing protein n=1 Tax=Curvularia kusanoi TaxID=90978 RepID=A0A9P4WBJ0_CURKU|nr:hypothetical protein E8E13_008727 [Curvularia kusanoi]
MRFSEVQLGDLGGCYPVDSEWATSGTVVGTPLWTSPEILMEQPWNTAADIWSFGTLLINLIYGGNFNILRPKGYKRDHEEYIYRVVVEQFKYFGPFPASVAEIFDPDTVESIISIMKGNPQETLTPFVRITEREVTKKNNVFISKMMKMDWRDRPTAKEILEDEWWNDDTV